MKNAYLGGQLKRLRETHAMTQAALARSLEISPSYLNQIERNQRPLTLAVLAKLDELFGAEAQPFHDAGDGRLASRLRQLGLTVAELDARDLPGVAQLLGKVASLLGRPEAATQRWAAVPLAPQSCRRVPLAEEPSAQSSTLPDFALASTTNPEESETVMGVAPSWIAFSAA